MGEKINKLSDNSFLVLSRVLSTQFTEPNRVEPSSDLYNLNKFTNLEV